MPLLTSRDDKMMIGTLLREERLHEREVRQYVVLRLLRLARLLYEFDSARLGAMVFVLLVVSFGRKIRRPIGTQEARRLAGRPSFAALVA